LPSPTRRQLEADRCGPVLEQGNAAGRHQRKAMRPARKRELVDDVGAIWKMSIRRVPVNPRINTSKSLRPSQASLKERIKAIAETRVRYGYRRIHMLLRREGWARQRQAREPCCTVRWACNYGRNERVGRLQISAAGLGSGYFAPGSGFACDIHRARAPWPAVSRLQCKVYTPVVGPSCPVPKLHRALALYPASSDRQTSLWSQQGVPSAPAARMR
jgi:HTH-like domain